MLRLFCTALIVAVAANLTSAEEPTAKAPQTLMLIPGKILLDDPLNASLDKEWKIGKGKWEVVDGALRGAEQKADMHGAVIRRQLKMDDAVIAFSFKLDGTKQISLSLNGAKGHISRVRITPKSLIVQKDDQDGKNGPDKAAILNTVNVNLKLGEWHTLVVELHGPNILATLDNAFTAYGKSDAIGVTKTNLGLTVAGETASFKGLKVWNSPGSVKDWESTKLKLTAGKNPK